MDKKEFIRKKYFLKRKNNYFEIDKNFFKPLISCIKKRVKSKQKNICLYYPSSYELNILKILDVEFFKKFYFSLPIIEENNSMNFYQWKKRDVLLVNKFGIPEPIRSYKVRPDIFLVPLLAFDTNKNRLGYGKGFYDKFLNEYIKWQKDILTVGVAFSFQKHHNLPVKSNDFKLDCVITEKGLIV